MTDVEQLQQSWSQSCKYAGILKDSVLRVFIFSRHWMGHIESNGRPNGEGASQQRVSHLSAFWARWLMSGMSKIMGKKKNQSVLWGTMLKRKESQQKTSLMGYGSLQEKHSKKKGWGTFLNVYFFVLLNVLWVRWDVGWYVGINNGQISEHTCTHVFSTSTSSLPNKHPRQRQQSFQPCKSSKRNAYTHGTIHPYCLNWSQPWKPPPTQPATTLLLPATRHPPHPTPSDTQTHTDIPLIMRLSDGAHVCVF